MTPLEFAQIHLGEFKIHGNEIIPRYCPFCHGGNSKDKHTFAVNRESGTYNCKRGSCGVSGTFWSLKNHFGEVEHKVRDYEIRPQPKKEYKTPQVAIKQVGAEVEAYLKRRGFSKYTWEKRGVGEVKGNIAMPYYQNGKLVLVKFRPAHKPKDGEKKGWREAGGKPVFWGMDQCDINKPLVIVEGEMDALALDEAGIENVVSVPSGAEDLTCVDECWDWLVQFRQVVIWVDNDDPGIKLQRNLINRIGSWRCSVVVNERKDANEVLLYDGVEAVQAAVNLAKEIPINGLIRLADVPVFDLSKVVRVRSGFPELDKVTGGFFMGNTSLWTGISGHGKSTLVGQLILTAIDQGFSVCAFSGELIAQLFRYWIDLQAAGPLHLEYKYDSIMDREIAHPKKEVIPYIRDWYRDKFFLHDCYGGTTEDNLLEVFEYATQRYGCKVFLIDNLMMMSFANTDRDFYRKQGLFLGKVMEFDRKFGTHTHLIAHPKKTDGRIKSKQDISGTNELGNRPDNVFSVYRLPEEEAKEEGYHAAVDVFKGRFLGGQDVSIRLRYNSDCKRFYQADGRGIKDFSWVKLLPEKAKQAKLDTAIVDGVEVVFENPFLD
jgi:twinkle protein